MNRSETITELATALALAQGEIKNPVFDSVNPHFKSKYASLAAVRDAVTPALSKHGIAIVQFVRNSETGAVQVETLLVHKSGEFLSTEFAVPTVRNDAHSYGAACTYARKYSLQAIVGVVGDSDDDSNSIVGTVPPPAPVRPAAKQQTVAAPQPTDQATPPPSQNDGDIAASILADILDAESVDALRSVAKRHGDAFRALPANLQATISSSKKARMDVLSGNGGK